MTPARRASTEKTRPSVFWLCATLATPLVGILARITVRGGEKLPMNGPFVLVVNHISEVDPLIVAVATWRVGRAPRFLAKESLFRVPFLGGLLRATGMVPVARTGGASAAFAQAKVLTDLGRGVIIYPEATLTRDPDLWPMKGKSGAVRLALAGNIPIIPMAQWGAQRIMPPYGKFALWPPRKPVEYLIGDPIDLSAHVTDAADQSAVNAATEHVMDVLTSLVANLRGETPPTVRWDPAKEDGGRGET